MNINKIIAGYREAFGEKAELSHCLLYTSDAADD